jgi:DNA-binding SARP family transcriptional activator
MTRSPVVQPHDPAPTVTDPGAVFMLHTLGRLELLDLTLPEMPAVLQRGKPLALLAYCAAERRRAHSRDTLCALLWADAVPERSRHNVRQALWRLRRVLGETLSTRDDAVTGVGPALQLDREQFLHAVAREDVTAALSLYHGPFLADLALPGGDEFEAWAAAERGRLEDALVRLVETVLRREPPRLKPADRRTTLAALLTRAPDSLDARRLAVEVHLDLGDRVGARREADSLAALAARLDLPLSPAMQASIGRARSADPEPSEQRPTPFTLELVGRDDAFATTMSAWARARRGDTELVILQGVAGVGKSRLLRAIADRCSGKRPQVLSVRANAGELDVPFAFAALLARGLCGLRGAAGISADSARELVALDPGLASRFAGVSGSPEAGELVRRRALAVLDLLQAVAEQQPLLLLLDDLHWLDSASRQLVTMVLARMSGLPLLVVGAMRPERPLVVEHPALQRIDLPPLTHDATLDTLQASGTWPNTADSEQFVGALVNACEGIPLEVVERLTLAIDAGLLALCDGQWSSRDWRAATQLVAASAPLTRRLRACTADERALLLVLAVAGMPLSANIVVARPEDAATLRTLEAKGFVRREHARWQPVHDVVVESLLADSATADVAAAHRQLTEALVRTRAPEHLPMAVRHFCAAGADDEAGNLFVQVVAQARARGDRRPATQLLTDIVGAAVSPERQQTIVQRIRWHQRQPGAFARLWFGLSLVTSVAAATFAWASARKPSLNLSQAALVAHGAPLFGTRALRLVPSIVVRVGNGRTADTGARVVQVRPLDSDVTILAGDRVTAERGLARFGGLRLASSDSVIRLRFESPGYRPVDAEVRVNTGGGPAPGDDGIHLVEGRFTVGGIRQTVRGPDALLRVPADSLLNGVVQMQYSSSHAAASVWASVTPTWGKADEEGRELLPLTTPVRWDVVDLPVTLKAPSRPGHHWILFTVAAEPSGGFALSATNWTMNRPLWHDGNDLAHLPDAVIRQANHRGTAAVMTAYPMKHRQNRPECRVASATVMHCPARQALFGIEVVVY